MPSKTVLRPPMRFHSPALLLTEQTPPSITIANSGTVGEPITLVTVQLQPGTVAEAPQNTDGRDVLLAFDGTDPAVLCYPVNPGEVGDPMIREAALFQAAAVAQGVTSRFVWVSDGLSDLFYDFRMRLVLSELPYRITTGTVGP